MGGASRELVQGERWIIDGNYGGTMQLRLAAADTIVFLDLPRLVCVWARSRRWLRYRRRSRPDMAPGLNDKLDLDVPALDLGLPEDAPAAGPRQLASCRRRRRSSG